MINRVNLILLILVGLNSCLIFRSSENTKFKIGNISNAVSKSVTHHCPDLEPKEYKLASYKIVGLDSQDLYIYDTFLNKRFKFRKWKVQIKTSDTFNLDYFMFSDLENGYEFSKRDSIKIFSQRSRDTLNIIQVFELSSEDKSFALVFRHCYKAF